MRLLRLLYTLPLRLRSLFRCDQVAQDLEDEFRDHLERRTSRRSSSSCEESIRTTIATKRLESWFPFAT